jgi:hypothetical protein
MDDIKFSRRKFMKNIVQCGTVIFAAGFVGGCGRKEDSSTQKEGEQKQAAYGSSCDDLSNISQSEIDKRDVYGYVDETPYPEFRCDNCSLYIPPGEEGNCGGCVLFEGPVFAAGYCDYWAPET